MFYVIWTPLWNVNYRERPAYDWYIGKRVLALTHYVMYNYIDCGHKLQTQTREMFYVGLQCAACQQQGKESTTCATRRSASCPADWQ